MQQVSSWEHSGWATQTNGSSGVALDSGWVSECGLRLGVQIDLRGNPEHLAVSGFLFFNGNDINWLIIWLICCCCVCWVQCSLFFFCKRCDPIEIVFWKGALLQYLLRSSNYLYCNQFSGKGQSPTELFCIFHLFVWCKEMVWRFFVVKAQIFLFVNQNHQCIFQF